jgi:uncharacterized OB-fold protein
MSETEVKQLPKYMSCTKCDWRGSTYRAGCPNCGAAGLIELETSGVGTIVDFVPVYYPPQSLKHLRQYVSVLVRFNEGFQMLGISLANPEDLCIGCSVVASNYDKETNRLFIDSV